VVSLPSIPEEEWSRGFPYIYEYNDHHFTHAEKLGKPGQEKLVFKVKEGDMCRVVKFVTEYNEAAHRVLAATDENGGRLAPVLHHVSS
jgi:hypothetical protein